MIRRPDPITQKYLDISNKKQIGATMISGRTGGGKTTQTVNNAIEQIDNGKYERVFIIEPRHSILQDVKDQLVDRGITNILYLQSSAKNARDNIDNIDISGISDPLLKDMVKNLKNCCASYENVKENESEDEPGAIHTYLDNVINIGKSEIKKYCLNQGDKVRKADIEEIKKIFPEELKSEHRFVLMTMDKLFHRFDVLSTDNRILSSRIFNNTTCLIVDETDKCYNIALNKLADDKDSLEDMLSTIQNAYAFISDTDNRWQDIDDPEDRARIEEQKRMLCERINELNKEYGVLNNFGFEEGEEKTLELFASRAQSFVASKKYFYTLVKRKHKTIIRPSRKRTVFNVLRMAIDCRDTVRHILNFIYELGNAYMHQNPNSTYEESLNYGISQVFNKTLGESDYYLNYAIDNDIKTQSIRIEKGDFEKDDSVCNNGFSHVIFENKPGTNHTYMKSAGINLTPENVFVWLAKKTNVIFLSATQQIPTITNPDIDYMKRILGDNFHCYSRDDFDSLNAQVENRDNIECDIINSFFDYEHLFMAIQGVIYLSVLKSEIGVDVAVRNAYNEIDDQYSEASSDCEYKRGRDRKRFFALVKFAFNKDAKSGIIILNSNYNDRPFRKFLNRISEIYDRAFIDQENIFNVRSDNFAEKMAKAKEKLNKGEKCLIISNKEAIGQGVNIQYDKDFNYIYLEEPTNIIPVPSLGSPLSEQDKNKLVYLIMKMAGKNEDNLSYNEMKAWISKVIRNQNHRSKDRASIKNAKTIAFIQALGRISRTSNKEEYEFINIDEALCNVLSLENLMAEKTPELLAVEERIKKYKETRERDIVDSMSEFERQLCENSNRLQKKVADLLTTFTHQNMIGERIAAQAEYKKILDTVYKYGLWPTTVYPEDEAVFNELGYVWCDSPKDLHVISKEDKYCEDLVAVLTHRTQESYMLNRASITAIKNYRRPEGECWMINPKAFNLLQGAVGERKFKELFEEEISRYRLVEPDLNEFETCGDFKVEGIEVYIDVKNFNEERGSIDISVYAENKLNMIHERNPNGKLVVVNVYAKKNYRNIDGDEILIVSNVLKEFGMKKRDDLQMIADWIDSKEEDAE